MKGRFHSAALVLVTAIGCSGDHVVTPDIPPIVLHSASVVVFYDENGNGALDGPEAVRVPDVTVEAAGHSGRSEPSTGRALVGGLSAGSYSFSVRTPELPPFFTSQVSMITVPTTGDAEGTLALTLPTGSNRPNVYMGFGDSITEGTGSESGGGYLVPLENMLRQQLGRATLVDEGASGTRTGGGSRGSDPQGVDRIDDSLRRVKPAYTLIHYGTNDWIRLCQKQIPCDTTENLRQIVRATKAVQSLPVLATIIPADPDSLGADERNEWIAAINQTIPPVAQQEGAILADLHAAFMAEPDRHALFSDHIHPNDRGYAVMASTFFRAITGPRGAAASGSAYR